MAQPLTETAQRLLDWLIRRTSKSAERQTKASGLVEKAATSLKMDLLDVREAFRLLRARGDLAYRPDIAGLPYSGFVVIKRAIPEEPLSLTRWRCALVESEVRKDLVESLLPAHLLFDDMVDDDLRRVAIGLQAVAVSTPHRHFGFEVSARHLLGSSKILGALPESVRRALGVADLSPVPRYIVVAAPSRPKAVLLIENSTCFEEAVRAGLHEEIGLVAAHGYGLNHHADSASGRALADIISAGDVAMVTRGGTPPEWPVLTSHPQLLFWGDLDREGLRIAAALRAKLPRLALSALYGPMLELAECPDHSHPYAQICGKEGQSPWRPTGHGDLDHLAAVCNARAVDQESVVIAEYRHLAALALGDAAP